MNRLKHSLKYALCLFVVLTLMFSTFAAAYVADDPLGPDGRHFYSSQRLGASVSDQAFSSGSYTHNSRYTSGYDIVDVIDVSYHEGTINWKKVYNDGIRYVIIRVGYRGYATGLINKDSAFEDYYTGAKAAGLKIGAYFFSQAVNSTEAKEEAKFVTSNLSGKTIDLPVAYDIEYAESGGSYTGRFYDAKLSRVIVTGLCNAFCTEIKNAGYDAMVYANKNMLTNDISTALLNAPVWVASYTNSCSYTGDYVMWQYTNKGKVAGIDTGVDCNFMYVKKESGGTTPGGNTTGGGQVVNGDSSLNVPIKISGPGVSFNPGATGTFKASVGTTVLDEKYGTYSVSPVTWFSSNENVFTVDSNGKLTAKSAGTAQLVAVMSVSYKNLGGVTETDTYSDSVAITVSGTSTGGSSSGATTGGETTGGSTSGGTAAGETTGGTTTGGETTGGAVTAEDGSFLALLMNLLALFIALCKAIISLFM